MKSMLGSLAGLVLLGSSLAAAPLVTITITGGKDNLKNAIVVAPLPVKPPADSDVIRLTAADGSSYSAQAAPSRLLAADSSGFELQIKVPELKPGQTLVLKGDLGASMQAKPVFAWRETDGLEELTFGPRLVLRYFHKPFDPKATPPKMETGNPTSKPYHHLFAADGKTIVTNDASGMYPHHRGIYYGFNNITYGDKKADVWHCRKNEHTAHEKVLAAVGGWLFGRQTLQIGWIGQDGQPFASEKRELTVYNLNMWAEGSALIEFDSVLTTPLDKVHLDGDPQHAGFHFRANSKMEKNTKETYFIRPDGKGEPGKETSWDPKTKKGPVNLPWDAMSFMLDGKRYTVVYLDHPDNPKEGRASERCYGRIGSYFEFDLAKDKPLKVRYRLWFQEGEPTVEQCAALSKAFTAAPTVKIETP
jgi:hypothetical protein